MTTCEAITYTRQGDSAPAVDLQCGKGGQPVDISPATAVEIRAALPSGPASHELTSPFPSNGLVHWVWEAGETDEVGKAKFVVIVTWGDGRKQTFPGKGAAEVQIVAQLPPEV